MRDEPVPMTPERQAGLAAFKAAIDTGMAPHRVAEAVFDAIQEERFYILPDPEWIEVVQLRTEKLVRMENPQSPMALIARLISTNRSNSSSHNTGSSSD